MKCIEKNLEGHIPKDYLWVVELLVFFFFFSGVYSNFFLTSERALLVFFLSKIKNKQTNKNKQHSGRNVKN